MKAAGSHMRASVLGMALAAMAGPCMADAQGALAAFSAHCFSPFLTAARAAAVLPKRYDFYDLDPFRASNPIAPPRKAAATPGSDRRCEVAFDGDAGAAAAQAATQALAREGITQAAPVPEAYAARSGTTLLAARFLNPGRIAVVHTGTRPGPNGTETFLTVERREPLQ